MSGTPGRGRGGRDSDRGGGRGGRGRSTPQKEPQTSKTPQKEPPKIPEPIRPAWSATSTISSVSTITEEFPSLKIVQSQPSGAWGAKAKQQPVQPTIIQEEKTPAKPEEKEKRSELISKEEPEELLEPTPSGAQLGVSEFTPKPTERGNLGRPIKLRANHYRLNIKPFTVYQYDVELNKKIQVQKGADKLIKNKTIMREMFLKFCDLLPAQYKNKIVYNFSKNLYSLIKLPFEEKITYEIEIEKSLYILSLKSINILQIDPKKYDDQQTINVLDLVMTQNFNYNCINLNRSFFKEGNDFTQIGFGLELWKGAFSSVRPSEIGLTWNLDSANAAFYTSQDLLELASYHYNCDYNKLKDEINRDKDGNIIGNSFIRMYQGFEIKTKTGGFRKKIKGFGPDSSYKFDWLKPNTTSPVKTTIKDYLKEHYGIILKYPTLPCVNLGRESYLPMELCKTELKNKKKLDEKETQEMIKIAAVRAPDRANYIDKWAQRSDIQKDPVLKEYKIDINLRMIEVDGRVLEPPDIQYTRQNKVFSKTIGEKGSWDHRNFKFNSTKKVDRWIVLNFAFRVREDAANEFIKKLIYIAKIHGIEMNQPLDLISETRRNRDEDIRRIIENVATKFKPLNLIVAFFGGTTTAYKMMKTCGDITFGIPTQGVEDRNVNRINDQTISNILLKINTKLGGTNFVLSNENRLFSQLIQQLYNGPLMIFGADVTHPGVGETQITESIAAVVGSLDKECCNYAARLYAQKSPKGQAYEMIHDLDKMFISLVQEYFNQNKTYPKKIVFYRDGVSEGQFSLVLRHEMNKMRSACIRINPSYKPAITFVIVQKRHHTRLFPVNRQDESGRALNIPPGTVVDKYIVTPKLYDFFLCSHMGIQGTSKPCRYFVLHDENDFTMNQIQVLSHYLCHVYSRCPRSVSLPAPAYYAHLAAFRGRDYIRKPAQTSDRITSYEIELHPNIRNKMFYT